MSAKIEARVTGRGIASPGAALVSVAGGLRRSSSRRLRSSRGASPRSASPLVTRAEHEETPLRREGHRSGVGGMRLALVLCIAFVTACTGSTPSDKPTGASVTGSGNMNSKPFHLDGDYSVKWAATPQSNVGCFHSASLRSVADGGREDTIMGVTLSGAASRTGTANLYAVASGEYFVKVITGCGAWRFDFTPS